MTRERLQVCVCVRVRVHVCVCVLAGVVGINNEGIDGQDKLSISPSLFSKFFSVFFKQVWTMKA
jgi:hypothetical protein